MRAASGNERRARGRRGVTKRAPVRAVQFVPDARSLAASNGHSCMPTLEKSQCV